MVAAEDMFQELNGYFLLYEHMGTFDGLGPFLLILAAAELTSVVSADCLAGLLYTLGHAQLWNIYSILESRLNNNALCRSVCDPLTVVCSKLSSGYTSSSVNTSIWEVPHMGGHLHPYLPGRSHCRHIYVLFLFIWCILLYHSSSIFMKIISYDLVALWEFTSKERNGS